jgi:putative aldouronate transport system substrate-binding protein
MSYGWGTGMSGGGDGLYYDDVADTWKYGPLEDNFKAMWMWLAKCYQEGILHPEVLTMNSDLFFTFWSEEKEGDYKGVAVNCGDSLTWEASNTPPPAETPWWTIRFVNPPIANVPGARGLYRNGRISAWESTIGHIVSSKVKNPEIIMKWLDYTFSEEGKFFHGWGEEGVNWEWYDQPEHGRIPAPLEGDKKAWNDNDFYNEFVKQIQFGKGFNFWGTSNYLDKYALSPPYTSAIKEQVQRRAMDYIVGPFPRVILDEFELEIVQAKQEGLTKYNQEMLAKFLIGKESFDAWDEYTAELKKMEAGLVVDIYNKAYAKTKTILAKLVN